MTDIVWTNCVVKLGDLKPWADNPRTSTKAQARRILKSFERFGQVAPIAIDPQLNVLDGHQRLSALLTVHGPGYEVEARRSSRPLTDDERRALVLALANATGSWNWDYLSNWSVATLGEWGFDKDTLKGWKADVTALGEFIKSEQPPATDAEAQTDRAAELLEKWGVQPGDLWQIGEHRLICGDCTDAATAERVMGGEQIHMVQIDPPYGVDYSGQNATMFYGKDTQGKTRERIEGDMTIDEAAKLLETSLVLYPAPLVFIWHAPQYHTETKQAANNAGLSVFSVIIWNKNHANFGAMGARYKPKYEMALACKVDKIPWHGPDNEVTVWDIDRAVKNELHPTQKPVELFARAIRNHTQEGEAVVDFFSGSGTTLVACENLGRKCRAVEISPAYVAVALERMEQAFGITGARVE